MNISLFPFAPENLVSRERFGLVPSRVSPFILHIPIESGAGIPQIGGELHICPCFGRGRYINSPSREHIRRTPFDRKSGYIIKGTMNYWFVSVLDIFVRPIAKPETLTVASTMVRFPPRMKVSSDRRSQESETGGPNRYRNYQKQRTPACSRRVITMLP